VEGAEELQERQQSSVLRCCGSSHAGKEDLREEHIARQKTHLNGDHTPNADRYANQFRLWCMRVEDAAHVTSERAKTRKAKRTLQSGDEMGMKRLG
jgi:hypothetical protein